VGLLLGLGRSLDANRGLLRLDHDFDVVEVWLRNNIIHDILVIDLIVPQPVQFPMGLVTQKTAQDRRGAPPPPLKARGPIIIMLLEIGQAKAHRRDELIDGVRVELDAGVGVAASHDVLHCVCRGHHRR
jgi:hypothetical protein